MQDLVTDHIEISIHLHEIVTRLSTIISKKSHHSKRARNCMAGMVGLSEMVLHAYGQKNFVSSWFIVTICPEIAQRCSWDMIAKTSTLNDTKDNLKAELVLCNGTFMYILTQVTCISLSE